jgi:hypothetical protein
MFAARTRQTATGMVTLPNSTIIWKRIFLAKTVAHPGVVLDRFPFDRLLHQKAPEGWRTPKTGAKFGLASGEFLRPRCDSPLSLSLLLPNAAIYPLAFCQKPLHCKTNKKPPLKCFKDGFEKQIYRIKSTSVL